MADKKITELDPAGAFADAHSVAAVQSGTTYEGTALQLYTYMEGKIEAADLK